jgi:hypothetical protein
MAVGQEPSMAEIGNVLAILTATQEKVTSRWNMTNGYMVDRLTKLLAYLILAVSFSVTLASWN